MTVFVISMAIVAFLFGFLFVVAGVAGRNNQVTTNGTICFLCSAILFIAARIS